MFKIKSNKIVKLKTKEKSIQYLHYFVLTRDTSIILCLQIFYLLRFLLLIEDGFVQLLALLKRYAAANKFLPIHSPSQNNPNFPYSESAQIRKTIKAERSALQ